MKMDGIEVVLVPKHLLDLDNLMRQVVDRFRRKPQGLRTRSHKLGGSHRITTGKERDIVAQADKFLSQPGNDSFRATVQLRWDALKQRRDLSNSHPGSSARAKNTNTNIVGDVEPREVQFLSRAQLLPPPLNKPK